MQVKYAMTIDDTATVGPNEIDERNKVFWKLIYSNKVKNCQK